jgi:hypothetical protein
LHNQQKTNNKKYCTTAFGGVLQKPRVARHERSSTVSKNTNTAQQEILRISRARTYGHGRSPKLDHPTPLVLSVPSIFPHVLSSFSCDRKLSMLQHPQTEFKAFSYYNMV